jgi:hypothetical protein
MALLRGLSPGAEKMHRQSALASAAAIPWNRQWPVMLTADPKQGWQGYKTL